MNTCADRLIRSGDIRPVIIVCPRIENSRGLNSSPVCQEVPDPVNPGRIINIGMYEDYFIREIIPLTDRSFNTLTDRKNRFAGGASAGGYAALHNVFRHQDLFSKAGGHMPALELTLEEEDKPYFSGPDVWEKYDPLSLAKNGTVAADIKIWLDAGDQDEGRFFEGCLILHNTLIEKGIHSENYTFPGHHSVEYIHSNMEKYLRFYGW